MSYEALADWVSEVERRGELSRIACAVQAPDETAEIVSRTHAQNGPALIFQRPGESQLPLASLLWGTRRRVAWAFGAENWEELLARVAGQFQAAAPTWLDRLRLKSTAAAAFAPKRVKSPICQQVVHLQSDVRLSDLPGLRPPPAATAAPTPGIRGATLWHASRDAAPLAFTCVDASWSSDRQLRVATLGPYFELDEPQPAALVIGGDSTLPLAARAPCPNDVDRVALAGLLRNKPLELAAARTIPLEIPAHAEIVIEGAIRPADGTFPGPSGWLFDVAAITQRVNPLMIAIDHQLPGELHSSEDGILRQAAMRMLLPLLQAAIPEVADIDLPPTAGGTLAIVAVRKRAPHEGPRLAAALRGWSPLSDVRTIILVDEGADVANTGEMLVRVATLADPAGDYLLDASLAGPRQAVPGPQFWDVSAPRLVIDATRKGRPASRTGTPVAQRVVERWSEYGLRFPPG